MHPTEIILVQQTNISCDGGGGALGHPLVYLALPKSGQIDCPYCGRRYVLDARAKQAHGH